MLKCSWINRVKLTEYKVPLPRLGPEFDGYRIVQLTDMHLGRRRTQGHRAIDLIRSLEADLVAITGDIIEHPRHAHHAEKYFQDLAAAAAPKDGFLAVLGNHDKRLDRLIDTDNSIRWLKNSATIIQRRSSAINIVGLDQQSWSSTDICQALSQLDPKYPTVALGHFPATAAILANIADLVISGHTHAGQIKLPHLPFLTNEHLGWKYGYGLCRIGRTYLIVCAGLGYSGPVSLRVFSPPEVNVITLCAS